MTYLQGRPPDSDRCIHADLCSLEPTYCTNVHADSLMYVGHVQADPSIEHVYMQTYARQAQVLAVTSVDSRTSRLTYVQAQVQADESIEPTYMQIHL